MTITDDTRLTVPAHVLARKAGGETVLLSMESEHYSALEGAANRLWELVSADGGATYGSVVTTMLDEFDVEPALLSAEAEHAVSTLAAKGLLTLG